MQKKEADVRSFAFTEDWRWVRWVSGCQQTVWKSRLDIGEERAELFVIVLASFCTFDGEHSFARMLCALKDFCPSGAVTLTSGLKLLPRFPLLFFLFTVAPAILCESSGCFPCSDLTPGCGAKVSV